MRVGIFFDNKNLNDLDYSNPLKFNPGISGTGIQQLLLIHLLSKQSNLKLIQFTTVSSKIYSDENLIVTDELDAISKLNINLIDIYITISIFDYNVIQLLSKNVIKTIFWLHNYVFDIQINNVIKLMGDNYRLVFCGRQFYDRYIDHDVIEYSTYIFNMIPKLGFVKTSNKNSKEFNVTFIGAIIPSKGFHILAKSWKKILKAIPNARLNVIGSGALYVRSIQLGKYNLAEEPYESIIMKSLLDADPELHSVKFHGILSEIEKRLVINNTHVGVVNPSARTETFGISSIDFQQQNVPVVIRMHNGLLDTFIPNKTGLGFILKNNLKNKIIKLYRDNDLRGLLMLNGPEFVYTRFSTDEIVKKWKSLINDFSNSKKPAYVEPSDYYYNNFKFLRIINRFIRFKLKLKTMPALIYFESTIHRTLNYCLIQLNKISTKSS